MVSIVRRNDETLDYTLGSARYMAPEFFNSRSKNNKDETVDIWAIGCITFEIFASSEAFNQIDRAAIQKAVLR